MILVRTTPRTQHKPMTHQYGYSDTTAYGHMDVQMQTHNTEKTNDPSTSRPYADANDYTKTDGCTKRSRHAPHRHIGTNCSRRPNAAYCNDTHDDGHQHRRTQHGNPQNLLSNDGKMGTNFIDETSLTHSLSEQFPIPNSHSSNGTTVLNM